MGIRKRIFLILLVVFIPLVLLEVFTFYRSYDDRKKAEMQANLEIARTVSKTFHAFIEDVLHTQLAIGLAATAHPAPSPTSLRHVLSEAEKVNPMLSSVTWVSAEGVNLVSTNPAVVNRRIAITDEFAGILSGEERLVTDVYSPPHTEERIFTIARAIRNRKGELLGIVSAVVDVNKLDRLLAVQRSKDAGISLIDTRGIHAYRYPRTAYTPQQLNWLKLYPVMKDSLMGQEVVTTIVSGATGKKRVVAFVPIPSVGWVAAASRAEDEVVADIMSTLRPQALLMLLVILAAFGTALGLSRPVVGAIVRLRDHADAVGRGEIGRIEAESAPGELKKLADSFNEMTEKIRVREQALQESEARQRRLFDSGIVGVTYFTLDGRIIDANATFLDMTGYSRDDLKEGRIRWDRMTPREYRDLDELAVKELVATGVNTAFEKEYIRKDGTRIPVIIGAAMFDKLPREGVAFVLDNTERKRAEGELYKSRDELELRVQERTRALLEANERLVREVERRTKAEREFQTLSENSPIIIARFSRELRYTYANPALEKISGIPNSQRIGRTIEELGYQKEIVEKIKKLLKGVFLNGQEESFEGEVQFGPKRAYVATTFVPEFGDDHEVKSVLAVTHDLTEQRRLEQQLRQSQKMEAVGTLAGGIAHDFNNMLAVILGNAELALDDLGGNDGPSGNIKQIIKASKRARDLTKQILTFSRKTERGRNPLRLTPLIKETFNMLRGTLPSTIGMNLDIRTESDTVLADPSQVQQIIVNLATNAADAMRINGGVLTFSLSVANVSQQGQIPGTELSPGSYVKLSVQDTGTGISQEIRNRVFEPFFTTKEPGKGTGMGLATVYGIVKNHDGDITVESTSGKGTTFSVFLPLAKAEAVTEREGRVEIPGGKEHILLVDDEPAVLQMTSRIFKGLGYEVTTAPGGPDAWKLFEAHPDKYDLVITDQVMPHLTGMGLARKILRLRQGTPVILFTGYSETVAPEDAKAAGIREFVMKPITKEEAAQTIRRVLDSKDREGE